MPKGPAKKPSAKKPAAQQPSAKKPLTKAGPATGAPIRVTAGEPVDGSAEALAEFAAEARKIAARDVKPLRADPALALHNVDAGLAAMEPHAAALAKLPAPFDLAKLRSMKRLALGLVFAAAQIDRSSAGTFGKLMTRAAALRDVLLASAVALMKAGVLPEKAVKKIAAGRGVRDLVQDCVDLAELFRKNAAAVAGKTTVTAAQVDEIADAGNRLLGMLKPSRGKAKVPAGVKDAVELRDRMWTLLAMRHREQLRRGGLWIWGDEVDEHVPALLSVVRGKGKGKGKAKKDAGGNAGSAGGGGGEGKGGG